MKYGVISKTLLNNNLKEECNIYNNNNNWKVRTLDLD